MGIDDQAEPEEPTFEDSISVLEGDHQVEIAWCSRAPYKQVQPRELDPEPLFLCDLGLSSVAVNARLLVSPLLAGTVSQEQECPVALRC